MINSVENQSTIVKRGDCAWNTAKRNLKARNEKVTNVRIIEEMNRLAKLNGCKDAEDFNKKFFSSVGKTILIDEATPQKEQKTQPKTRIPKRNIPNDTTARCDNIKSQRQRDYSKESLPNPDTVKQNIDTLKTTPDIITPVKKAAKKPKPAPKPVVTKPEKEQPKAEKSEIDIINEMDNDADRIIEYNKKNYNGEHYGIIDKKSCQLKIYDRDGNVIQTITVGVGKLKGDNLCQNYFSDNYDERQSGRYTTPGEFTLDEFASFNNQAYISPTDGKHKVMTLRGDNRGEKSALQSIHMIPTNYPERYAAFETETTEDNRMSYGCVNLKEEDYNKMAEYLGEGDKIYILPEEDGNKLQLEKQNDGSYKFEQQFHKDEKRAVSKETASTVIYDVRPERNPANLKPVIDDTLLADNNSQKETPQQQEPKGFFNTLKSFFDWVA